MAWGGLIFLTPPGATLDSLPADYSLPSLGSTSDVRSTLETLLPAHKHIDGQTVIHGDAFWIELNYTPAESVDSIGVRTNADMEAMAVLKSVCHALAARLYDNQTGDFTDFADDMSSSMEQFRNFRDRNRPSA